MKSNRIKLFHNKYRQIMYVPETKTLTLYWNGFVPESEQLAHIQYMQELIKIYEIEHIEMHTKKAKFASLKPVRIFIENVLKKVYDKGGKTFTIIQKPIKNELFVMNAYLNAIKSLGINMEFKMVTV